MIGEAYCSFEVAKLLKEKGFNISLNSNNWLCCMYDENGNVHWGIYDKNWCFRITHQMACAWLREKEIEVCVHLSCITWGFDKKSKNYGFVINDINNRRDYPNDEEDCKHYYPSYEEAVEAALKYALENLI